MTENIINEFFIIEWGNINYECGRAQTIKWRDEKKKFYSQCRWKPTELMSRESRLAGTCT